MVAQVVNVKDEACEVYVGRKHPRFPDSDGFWGNPFVIGRDGDRGEVIQRYSRYVLSRLDMLHRLSELRGKTLGCWCAPLPCHAEVLRDFANIAAPQHQPLPSVFDPLTQPTLAIRRGHANYPSQLARVLGDNAPQTLWLKGNAELLSKVALAVSGSRTPSQTGLAIARQCGRAMYERDVLIVSGYADGIDIAAHQAVLAAGGATIFVLAEGINRLRLKSEIAGLLNERNHLFVSQFAPDALWSGQQVMQRNLTIIGLSDALLITEARADGGTYACGLAAARVHHPFWVLDYASPPPSALGNRTLRERGGQPITVNVNGVADLAPLVSFLAHC